MLLNPGSVGLLASVGRLCLMQQSHAWWVLMHRTAQPLLHPQPHVLARAPSAGWQASRVVAGRAAC